MHMHPFGCYSLDYDAITFRCIFLVKGLWGYSLGLNEDVLIKCKSRRQWMITAIAVNLKRCVCNVAVSKPALLKTSLTASNEASIFGNLRMKVLKVLRVTLTFCARSAMAWTILLSILVNCPLRSWLWMSPMFNLFSNNRQTLTPNKYNKVTLVSGPTAQLCACTSSPLFIVEFLEDSS